VILAINIIAKGRRIAADLLEAAETDIRFEDGHFLVTGTNRSVALLEVAARAHAIDTPLDTYHRWTRQWMTFPNGAHVVEIEIDRETGHLTLERYTAVDDYGVLVNPMIVAGQVHGAIAQGVGQALFENAVYDPATGQPMTGSFMDYALPRADNLPAFKLAFNNTCCTTNPLGVKGCGEAGAIAALPAIVNAIYDALSPFGDVHIDGPATPERIWRLMLMSGNPMTEVSSNPALAVPIRVMGNPLPLSADIPLWVRCQFRSQLSPGVASLSERPARGECWARGTQDDQD
jgi:carbon-monoxide dehydrogenase large subunit